MDLMNHLIDSGELSPTDLTILYDTIKATKQFGIVDQLIFYIPYFPNVKDIIITKFSHHQLKILDFGNSLTQEDVKKIDNMYNDPPNNYQNAWSLIMDLQYRQIICEEEEIMDEFVNALKGLGLHRAVRSLVKDVQIPVTLKRRKRIDVDEGQPSSSKRDEYSSQEIMNHYIDLLNSLHKYKESTPAEILSRGPEALKAFNEALKEGETEVKQGRTIFVGLERVGKTSTINSLLRKDFNAKQEITDAIATTKLVCTQDAADETMLEEKSQDTSYGLYENAIADEMVTILERKRLSEASIKAAFDSDNSEGETSIKPLLESEPQKEYKVDVPEKSNRGSKRKKKGKHKDTSKRTKQEKKTEMPKNIQKTVEEKLKKREREIVFQKEGDSKVTSKEFVMNIWDFGGQPIYHVMQRIFMVSFAVVCVVFNLCDDLDAPAKVLNPTTGEVYDHRMTNLEFILHWIQSAYTNSRPDAKTNDGQPSPPIFLIGTHFNSLKGTEAEKKKRVAQIKNQIWQALAGKPFAALVRSTIFTIENSLPFSRSNGCDIIKEILDLSRKMIQILPIKWLQIQQEIQKLKKKHIYLPLSN
ncbi:uncharacterized protein [Antedon mediterranea]|uniref:uncharacterized protein n=1 Tax=Antedon mediterranea TaxID=105859 RepID=UPI003AF84728